MPRIDEALDTLQVAEYFSSLDRKSGFWQIPTNEAADKKKKKPLPDGLYEFNVMPVMIKGAKMTCLSRARGQ